MLIDSCHGCVCGPLTWDTKDIFVDDCVLVMTYESLAMRFLKLHILGATWSLRRWLCDQDGIICPQYSRRLTQGMRCDKILSQVTKLIYDLVEYKLISIKNYQTHQFREIIMNYKV